MNSVTTGLCVLLSGCAAGLGDDYACEAIGGVAGCTSMSAIRNTIESPPPQLPTPRPITAQESGASWSPTYLSPTPKRLTIFPKASASGPFVGSIDLYFTLSKGQWHLGSPQAWWSESNE
uniref:hypothetical protein n=1 Tax=Vibrio sp. TaxID=678 RepID=UPI001F24F57E|nr:hypothetical protein [Vibrio sp.]QXL80309.1 hypothetical protein [Vibrio sp.]